LPCGIDVYLDLDEYNSNTTCALVYLHDLKNDTKNSTLSNSLLRSRYFRQMSESEIEYQRQDNCKIRNKFQSCLNMTQRESHCLLNFYNLDDNTTILEDRLDLEQDNSGLLLNALANLTLSSSTFLNNSLLTILNDSVKERQTTWRSSSSSIKSSTRLPNFFDPIFYRNGTTSISTTYSTGI
jgi:hypothetical protein